MAHPVIPAQQSWRLVCSTAKCTQRTPCSKNQQKGTVRWVPLKYVRWWNKVWVLCVRILLSVISVGALASHHLSLCHTEPAKIRKLTPAKFHGRNFRCHGPIPLSL